MAGQCPKCEAPLSYVRLEDVSVKGVATSWRGVSYICPHCSMILGVGIDPVALKSDTVEEVVRALKKR